MQVPSLKLISEVCQEKMEITSMQASDGLCTIWEKPGTHNDKSKPGPKMESSPFIRDFITKWAIENVDLKKKKMLSILLGKHERRDYNR